VNEYRGLEGEWHDQFWAEEEANELPLLQKFLGEISGEVLYVGSGSGRLLGPLHEQGVKVTGVEASEEMVELSRQAWPDAPAVAERWEDFELTKTYGAVIVPAFTLQLLEQPVAALKKMREAVEDEGRLYLSLFFPWIELTGEVPAGKWYEDRELALEDGCVGKMWTRHKVDERKATLKREHRYKLVDASGKTLREETTKQTIRWFADGTLERMLKNSGWEIEKEISNFGEEMEEDDVVYVVTLFLKAI